MVAWLYQMTTNNEEPWGPEEYRMEVWEGNTVTWPVGSIDFRGGVAPKRGDILVLFFSKSKTDEPGLYGWGIITDVISEGTRPRLRFVPSSPSDFLKMSVCWDGEVEKLSDQIRGKVKQKTMWAIKPEEMREIRKKIHHHIAQGPVG